MIGSFRSKGLRDLFERGDGRKVRPDLKQRILRRLDALDNASSLSDLDLPGFGCHPLHGNPTRHAIAVNGPWRITFEWRASDAWEVDLEQYH